MPERRFSVEVKYRKQFEERIENDTLLAMTDGVVLLRGKVHLCTGRAARPLAAGKLFCAPAGLGFIAQTFLAGAGGSLP